MSIRRKWMWIGGGVGLVVLVALNFSAITTIPPDDMTRNCFISLQYRIYMYVLQGHEVTNSLDLNSLPELPDEDNSTVDGWGNPIIISVNGSIITLKSYGKDGKPGGTGQNKDMEHQFSISSLSKKTSAITTISPEDMTRNRFISLQYRIYMYVLQRHDVTNSLDLNSLPELPGRDNSTVDGWGNPIIISVNGSIITLKSYGKDGKPGGTGQNKDMEHQFSIYEFLASPLIDLCRECDEEIK